jgi:hypothetical protein
MAGTWSDDRGTTVAAWLDQWLSDLDAKGRSPKTLANYRGHVRDLWQPRLGPMKLRDVRRAHIERALASLVGPARGPQAMSAAGSRDGRAPRLRATGEPSAPRWRRLSVVS